MSKVIQLLFGISKSGTQQLAVALDDEVLDHSQGSTRPLGAQDLGIQLTPETNKKRSIF